MLSYCDLTVRLGGRAIIEGASASIPPWARVGFIGRNGAGKSTLMKALAGTRVRRRADRGPCGRSRRAGAVVDDPIAG